MAGMAEFRRAGLHYALMALTLCGCAGTSPAVPVLDERASAPTRLEERLQTLAEKYTIEERPTRDPEQIRAQIARLEERRQSLMLRFTAEHPAVVQINRQIRVLQERLAAIEAAPAATNPPAP